MDEVWIDLLALPPRDYISAIERALVEAGRAADAAAWREQIVSERLSPPDAAQRAVGYGVRIGRPEMREVGA